MNGLIKSIGQQLNIPITDTPDCVCRIIYSIAGQMALASLWDSDEGYRSVSVIHFKERISQIIDAYKSICPEVKELLPDANDYLASDIYNLYLRNGFFYHTSHRISHAVSRSSAYNEIVLHRGSSPDADLYMSGLGLYSIKKNESDSSVADMFGLQKQPLNQYLEELICNGSWQEIPFPDDAEYLRLDPPFSSGYWNQKPEHDGRISLARYGSPQKIYVFYRRLNGLFLQKSIPEWIIKDYYYNSNGFYGEYRRISNALLYYYGTLPPHKATILGDLVRIDLGYRLPPSEEDFLNLFSWPEKYNYPEGKQSVFTRLLSKQLYPLFKCILTDIGYCIVEES